MFWALQAKCHMVPSDYKNDAFTTGIFKAKQLLRKQTKQNKQKTGWTNSTMRQSKNVVIDFGVKWPFKSSSPQV